MSYGENRQTDGQTDIQDDRIKHSCEILNKLCCSTYTTIPQEWVRVHVHYVVLHALCMYIMENLQFDRVQGHVRDPSSNSMLLLTSSIYVQNFSILRPIVFELW